MNILYGVAGVGYGHSSRALVTGDYLKKKGHNVIFLTYGDAYEVLKNKFECFLVDGLKIIFKNGVVKKRNTWSYNVKNFPKNFKNWKKFYELIKEFKPDLCISDMEPIVPILSNWYSLPLISIDNQHRIINLDIKVPKEYKKDFLIAKAIVNNFVRRADKFIVISLNKNRIIKPNTVIAPPIIRKEICNLRPVNGEKILVYLSKSDKSSLKCLKNIPETFVVYGFNIRKKSGNLEFKTKESFLDDLKKCKCIIATAGFSLMSESIYLKKPYFAIPLKGQFEQILNALSLKKSGFGDYSNRLNQQSIEGFLKKLNFYSKNLKKSKIDYNKIFRILDKCLKDIERA